MSSRFTVERVATMFDVPPAAIIAGMRPELLARLERLLFRRLLSLRIRESEEALLSRLLSEK